MNHAQILKISYKYEALLQGTGAKPQRADTSLNINPGDTCIYDHCLWMCLEIQLMSPKYSGKALRWICFIQGVLWNSGILNIDSMREDNRLVLVEST